MTDLMTRLTTARPTGTELDAMWSSADRGARLAAILAADRRRRRTRRTALPAAAATVAAVAFVVPVIDSGNAAAADLRALAKSAVSGQAPVLAQGVWLHEKATSVQHDEARGGHPAAVYANTYETWTSWDGQHLVIDHETTNGTTDYGVSDGPDRASYQAPTPAFSATLPDTAQGLLDYLDPKVFGSSSHAEAMYSALIDLAGSYTLPPATLAAAFDALAQIDHVTTNDVDVEGRPAIEVSYDEQLTSSTDAYVFDRATGLAVSTHNYSKQSDYVSTTTLSEVVDAVPADVQAEFRKYAQTQQQSATAAP